MRFITAVVLVSAATVLFLQQAYAILPPEDFGFIYVVTELDPDSETEAYTGYYKIGATGMGVPSIIRGQLNVGNPRRLEVIEFTKVKATREAKAKVQEAVQGWKLSRGKDWYYVPGAQFDEFINAYKSALSTP